LYALSPFGAFYHLQKLSEQLYLSNDSTVATELLEKYDIDVTNPSTVSVEVGCFHWIPIFTSRLYGPSVDDYLEDHTTNIIEGFHSYFKNMIMNRHNGSLEFVIDNLFYMWDAYMVPTMQEYKNVDLRVQECMKHRHLHMYDQLCRMEEVFQSELRMGMALTLQLCKKMYWGNQNSSSTENDDTDYIRIRSLWPAFANILKEKLHLPLSSSECIVNLMVFFVIQLYLRFFGMIVCTNS